MRTPKPGRSRTTFFYLVWLALAATLAACGSKPESPKAPQDHDLLLTIGGFMRENAEGGTLTGECDSDASHTTVHCEIFNGIQGWTVTQVTIQVAVESYSRGGTRSFQSNMRIPSFTSQRTVIPLGLTLPADERPAVDGHSQINDRHWSWTIIGARGFRTSD